MSYVESICWEYDGARTNLMAIKARTVMGSKTAIQTDRHGRSVAHNLALGVDQGRANRMVVPVGDVSIGVRC